jgi:hypothetical protein
MRNSVQDVGFSFRMAPAEIMRSTRIASYNPFQRIKVSFRASVLRVAFNGHP